MQYSPALLLQKDSATSLDFKLAISALAIQQRPNRKHFCSPVSAGFGVFSVENIKYRTKEQEKKQDDM